MQYRPDISIAWEKVMILIPKFFQDCYQNSLQAIFKVPLVSGRPLGSRSVFIIIITFCNGTLWTSYLFLNKFMQKVMMMIKTDLLPNGRPLTKGTYHLPREPEWAPKTYDSQANFRWKTGWPDQSCFKENFSVDHNFPSRSANS